MSEATTAKQINLYQLGLEMGNPPLRMVDRGDERTIRSDVDQSTLDAAVAAHTADPNVEFTGDPGTPDPTEDERLADLEAALNALAGGGE